MFFCVITINAHGLHRLSYFKWFAHFIDRSKLTQIPNGYTYDVIPFLKTHNNDISTYLVFIIPRLLNFTLKYSFRLMALRTSSVAC